MRGRPPTPAHLKLIRGNPGKRRIRPEPQPTRSDNVPEPPTYLTAYGRAEWVRLASELHHLHLLAPIDAACFAVYCEAYALWRRAEEAHARADDPAAAKLLEQVARAACKDMVSYAAQFGLTPVSRARLGIG
jgi:P27 family predicted phage terminase small subunit